MQSVWSGSWCHLNAFLSLGLGWMERSVSGYDAKNQSLQIILVLDLTVLKFNDLLTIDFLVILSNCEERLDEHKTRYGAR